MKSVLISIQPKWCHRIIDGEKKIEVRKTKPKLATPFKVYIYCSAGSYDWRKDIWTTAYRLPNSEITNMSQMVIGEFVCDCITPLYNVCTDEWRLLRGGLHEIEKQLVGMACLTEEELHEYANGKYCYAWHISDLKIYNKPRELSDFKTPPCEKSEKSCGKCKYLVKIDTPDMYEVDCFVENGREITRPPQSWCYVEERKMFEYEVCLD